MGDWRQEMGDRRQGREPEGLSQEAEDRRINIEDLREETGDRENRQETAGFLYKF
jgi:hypothetical protein